MYIQVFFLKKWLNQFLGLRSLRSIFRLCRFNVAKEDDMKTGNTLPSLIVLLILTFLFPASAFADKEQCIALFKKIVWEYDRNAKPIKKGSGKVILQELFSQGYSIEDTKIEKRIERDSRTSINAIYKYDFDKDGEKDFVYISVSGKAQCQRPVFLKSVRKKLNRVAGINTSSLENEGGLCSNWGQSLSVMWLHDNYYMVAKNFNVIFSRPDLGKPPQNSTTVGYAVYQVGITEKSKPICKVSSSVSVN